MENKMTFREMADEVKARINCLDYALDMGLIDHEDGSSYRGYSLIGGNNPTCFMIYKNNPSLYTDWKADSEGDRSFTNGDKSWHDVIDLCAEVNHNGDKGEALKELIKKTGIDISWRDSNTSRLTQKQLELPEKTAYFSQLLLKNKDFLNNLHARKINDKTIAELQLGYSPFINSGEPITLYEQDRLFIPYLLNGKAVYYCTRLNHNYTPSKKRHKYLKAKKPDYGEQICWGLDTVKRKTPLIIAEGAFDAMSFYQEGYAVLSSLGGHFNELQKSQFLSNAKKFVKQGKDVILVFDTDGAGKGFTIENARFLFDNHVPFKTATVPGGYKDVSEYYQDHEEVKGILETAQNGLKTLTESFKSNKQGFKAFVKKASRYHSNINIALIFNYAKKAEMFDSFWLKELEKECKKAPIETEVCSEIMKKHNLIFSEGSGFYEYEDNIWKLKTDTDIRAYIADTMGKFSTGNKSSSVIKLLADKCNSHIEFNKKPLMSFNNGTLELDTGILRRHLASDYLTVKANYDYDPEAKCPKWDIYLHQVTGNTEEKISLLQEIMGYCLYTENTLQKCAYLKGLGGNGKSIYLEILEAVFGRNNISTLELDQLREQFHRIQLKDSIINISADQQRTDIRGAESIFKKLTVGEPIDGCLKYQNIVYFRPRAKLIISANDFVTAADSSYALVRRMNFVSFNETFKLEGDLIGEHEHRANPNLTKELEQELPGIFNWAYEGYKRLKRTECFTLTQEGKELLKEFQESLDPVTAFINNVYEDTDLTIISNERAYHDYLMWVEAEHRKYPLTKTNFKKRFKVQFLKTFPDWEAYRTKAERGVRKAITIEDFEPID